MDTEISLVIEKMRIKRQMLLDKVEKVNQAIASLEEIFGVESNNDASSSELHLDVAEDSADGDPRHSPPIQNSNIPAPYSGMTIHNAALRVIRAFGRPLKTRFIADELTNGGLNSRGMYRAVYNSLSLSEEAVLVDKSWQLREWGTEASR